MVKRCLLFATLFIAFATYAVAIAEEKVYIVHYNGMTADGVSGFKVWQQKTSEDAPTMTCQITDMAQAEIDGATKLAEKQAEGKYLNISNPVWLATCSQSFVDGMTVTATAYDTEGNESGHSTSIHPPFAPAMEAIH